MNKTLVTLTAVMSVLLVLVMGLLGMLLLLEDNYLVDWRVYPKNAETLDLQGKKISLEHYEKVQDRFPHTRILWDIPLSEGSCPNDATEVRLTALTAEDVDALDYATELTYVDARECRDYDQLLELRRRHPGCRINCSVTVDGQELSGDTVSVAVSHLTDRDVELLSFLSDLKEVDGSACRDYAQLAALQERLPECRVSYSVEIAGREYSAAAEEITLKDADMAELMEKLPYLKNLKQVSLTEPRGNPEELATLQGLLPDTRFAVEKQVLGVTIRSTDAEADFSGAQGLRLEEVEQAMAWFPDVKQVFLGECGIDNEQVARFRESKRQEYKVVWTVMCGKIPVRTDETSFMPLKHGYYYFFDQDCYNLRYCEDMIAVDIGHMAVTDLSWVEGTPHLKYLILAHSGVLDITPLSSCKELLFLELDWTGVKDLSPLLGCTALEDLNIGNLHGLDVSPILQMTWLKNVWCINSSQRMRYQLSQGMPASTKVQIAGLITVDMGWRNLQNYYDMRDALGMPYM